MMATFWVTSDCNLNCKYCYEGYNKLKRYMSEDTVDRSIEYIFNYFEDLDKNNFIISIHGGEPFLAFNTIKYIVYKFKKKCHDKNIKAFFATTTNATLLNDEMIEFIVNEICDVTVSIDGTKETHDNMRPFKNGGGSHDIALKNAHRLLKYLPNMRIRTTFDSFSVNNLYMDIKFLIDEGFRCIVPVPNLFDKNWDEKSLFIFENQMKQLKKYVRGRKDLLVSIIDTDLYHFKGRCGGGRTSIQIYPDGKLYPCTIVTGNNDFCIGDIYSGIDINKRDNLLGYSDHINIDCDGCKLYNYCNGPRCKIINKFMRNDYLLPSSVECAVEHIKYKINLLEEC
jgi:uncharacterized protein